MALNPLLVDALPTGSASLSAWLEEMERLADAGAQLEVDAVDGALAMRAVNRLTQIATRVAAVKLALVARVDELQAARSRVGATSTAAWLHAGGAAPGAATREVVRDSAITPTRDAMAAGVISPEQAQVITTAVGALSDQVVGGDREEAERRLLDAAAWSDPVQLRKLASAEAARLDPSGSGDLEAREQRMLTARELTISRDRDGMHRIAGRLDPVGAAQLVSVLDPLAAPRPAADGEPDPRTPGQRRADALVDMARLASAAEQGKDADAVRPTVLVTIDYDTLAEQVRGSGELLAGPLAEPVSVATVRRLACDARLIPAVLGGPSVQLDLGRQARTATAAQRLALVRRDGASCAFPGCDRPFGWTDAHHIQHWSAGGRTAVDNLVLLCGAHHDSVHHRGWTITMEGGRPRFRPPPQPPDDG
jgi:Domain of unknown function (DUF222)/HNH endonuclease